MKIALLILLILLGLVIVVLMYFLVSPFRLTIDTRIGLYRAGWRHLAYLDVAGEADEWGLNLYLFGWKRRYAIDELIFTKKPVGVRVTEHEVRSGRRQRNKRPRALSFSGKRMFRILRQFHMNRFRWDLDTDDVIVNAYLTPVFEAIRFWSRGKYSTRVNFLGRNSLILDADTRMINLLRAGYL